jgi:hypothetical protein
MVIVTRSLRLVTVAAGVGVTRGDGGGDAVDGRSSSGGVSRSDGGDDAEGSGVAGISGGSAGSSSGEASSSVIGSGVAGDGWSDGGAG